MSPGNRIKHLLNVALVVYLMIFVVALAGGIDAGPFKVHNPFKVFFVLTVLAFLRFLFALTLRRALLVLASFSFSIIVIEAALHIVDVPMARTPELQRWRRPSPTLGWDMVPNLRGIGSYGYEISINSQGLRDAERTPAKPAGTKRILGIGDSFTFGIGVDLDKTFLKRLQALLVESGQNADVINAGQIGYTMYQSLTFLKERGLAYQPDIVVYGFFLDDVTGPTTPLDMKKTYEAMSAESTLPPKTVFYLPNLVRNTISFLGSHFRYMQGADWLKDAESRRPHFSPPDTAQVDVLRGQLAEMKSASDSAGATLVVLVIPDASQLHYPPLKKINQVLDDLCKEMNIPFVDATPLFEEVADPTSLYLFPVDAHTSAKGNEIIAKALFASAIRE